MKTGIYELREVNTPPPLGEEEDLANAAADRGRPRGLRGVAAPFTVVTAALLGLVRSRGEASRAYCACSPAH